MRKILSFLLLICLVAGGVYAQSGQSVPLTGSSGTVTSGGTGNGVLVQGSRASGTGTDSTVSPVSKDATVDSLGDTIRYRLMFADWGIVENWPWGNERYLPIRKESFEKWTARFRKESETPDELFSMRKSLLSMILEARVDELQLVDGRGFLKTRINGEGPVDVRLKPLGIWLSDPKWQDGSPVGIGSNADEDYDLEVDREGIVRFDWSLRGRSDSNRNTVFELALPQGPMIELYLDVPENMVPRSSVGLVFELDPDHLPTAEGCRKWRIPLGGHNTSQLTIQSREPSKNLQEKIGIHQSLTYDLTPQGLDVSSSFLFEKISATTPDVVLELEKPLRAIRFMHGQKPIEDWSRLPDSEDGFARVLLKANDMSGEESNELRVIAQGQITWEGHWRLPRIRLSSPNIFWTETRSTMMVMHPLLVRELEPIRASRTLPGMEYPDREVFSFLYFDDKSGVELDLTNYEPKVIWNSGTDIKWNRNEITGTVTADYMIDDGTCYRLNVPLRKNWSIDSIESEPKGMVVNWELTEAPGKNGESGSESYGELTVYLKSTMNRGIPLRLIFNTRCDTRNDNPRLEDMVPIPIPIGNGTQHYLAIEPSPLYRLRFHPLSNQEEVPVIRQPDYLIRQKFSAPLSGNGSIVLLSPQTLDARPYLESLRPAYSAEIACVLSLKKNIVEQVYHFRCIPDRTRIERILVRFSEKSENGWKWSFGADSERAPTVRIVPDEEIIDAGGRITPGELWEIRLGTSRSSTVDLYASRSFELSGPQAIPLATLSEAAEQQAEISIDSPIATNLEFETRSVRSVPERSPDKSRFQTIRSAFRYEPVLDYSDPDAPFLGLTLNDEHDFTTPTAWAWSMQLSSLFESNGIVRQRAVFYIENRGKDQVEIIMPSSIRKEDIHAVWVDEKRDIMHRETVMYEDRKGADPREYNLLNMFLPERKRYTSIAIEYSTHETALMDRRKLRPVYPSIDIPVLSGNWWVWIPPEYHLFTIEGPSGETTLSRAINRLFFPLRADPPDDIRPTQKPMHPFSVSDWRHSVFTDYEKEVTHASARRFLESLGNRILRSERLGNSSVASANADTDENGELEKGDAVNLSWGELFEDEEFLQEAFEERNPLIYIDRFSMNRRGISPLSQIHVIDASDPISTGLAALNRSGLKLLFLDEDTFLVTTGFVAATHRNELEPLEGDGVWLISPGYLSNMFFGLLKSDNLSSEKMPGNRSWIPVSQWVTDTSQLVNPWSHSRRNFRFSSLTPGWTAHVAKVGDADKGIYIIQRNTVSTYRWIMMFAVIALTWKRPLSNMSFLFFLLCVFGTFALTVSPYYVGIANGAFFGTIISIGFAMVRTIPKKPKKKVPPKKQPSDPISETEDESSPDILETPMMRLGR